MMALEGQRRHYGKEQVKKEEERLHEEGKGDRMRQEKVRKRQKQASPRARERGEEKEKSMEVST